MRNLPGLVTPGKKLAQIRKRRVGTDGLSPRAFSLPYQKKSASELTVVNCNRPVTPYTGSGFKPVSVQRGSALHQAHSPIPRCPRQIGGALGMMPLGPLSLSLNALTKLIAGNHPGLFRRLGPHASARYILDPTDLPFAICLEPNGGSPRVRALRRKISGDVLIAGPFAALLGLVHGAYDGDALFFSRDLVIEGDTSAALALRNAIDDAELDLFREVEQLSGPFARPLRLMIGLAERNTGLFLSRVGETSAW